MKQRQEYILRAREKLLEPEKSAADQAMRLIKETKKGWLSKSRAVDAVGNGAIADRLYKPIIIRLYTHTNTAASINLTSHHLISYGVSLSSIPPCILVGSSFPGTTRPCLKS